MFQRINPRWQQNSVCAVAASGPSLTADVARLGVPIVAVNDAWRVLPTADVLYAADAKWWEYHKGCMGFPGERWSTHSLPNNNKLETAERYGLNLVRGTEGEGFSDNPARLHYGSNSGFQGINLALHLMGWAGRILLFGFDMRGGHFFGDHPLELRSEEMPGQDDRKFRLWFREFDRAAKLLPKTVEVINCTPNTALPSFPKMELKHTNDIGARLQGAAFGLCRR